MLARVRGVVLSFLSPLIILFKVHWLSISVHAVRRHELSQDVCVCGMGCILRATSVDFLFVDAGGSYNFWRP